VELAVVEVDAGFAEVVEIGEDSGYSVDRVVWAGDVDSVGAEVDGDVQTVFEEAKVFVAGPIQGLNTRRDFDSFFIQVVI
jgi:hypothetical protein